MTLDPKHLRHIQSFTDTKPPSILDRQLPLRKRYHCAPDAAWVYDYAKTVDAQAPANHQLHGHVVCGEGIPVDIPISVHKAEEAKVLHLQEATQREVAKSQGILGCSACGIAQESHSAATKATRPGPANLRP